MQLPREQKLCAIYGTAFSWNAVWARTPLNTALHQSAGKGECIHQGKPCGFSSSGSAASSPLEDASRTTLGSKGVKPDPDFLLATRPVLSVSADVSPPEPANERPGEPGTAHRGGVACGCHSAVRNDTRAGGGSAGTRGKKREKKQIKPRQGGKRCPAPLAVSRPPPPLPAAGGGLRQRGRARTSRERSPARRGRDRGSEEKGLWVVRSGGA